MPAIKRDQFTKTDKFNSTHSQTLAHNENNDCMVKCFALATNTPYKDALEIAASFGRKPGKGMYPHQWKAMFKASGYKLVPLHPAIFIGQYPKAHQILKSVTTHHPDRFNKVWADGRNYILHCNRHVAYVENGTTHDWTRGRSMRVHTIYHVVKED